MHSDSGVEFSNFRLPQWKAVFEVAMQTYKVFYGIRSIGGDIAITNDSPEDNDNWEIYLNQVADIGLAKNCVKRWRNS